MYLYPEKELLINLSFSQLNIYYEIPTLTFPINCQYFTSLNILQLFCTKM